MFLSSLFVKVQGQGFGFVRVIFVALMFLLLFGLLSPVVSDSTSLFVSSWGADYPFVSWLYSGLNVWIFIGGVLGIIGALVWGFSND